MNKKSVGISVSFWRLLGYIVTYKRLRSRMSGSRLVEQLILAYAKQLATGMPEELWRKNILLLINQCEADNQLRAEKHKQRLNHFAKRERSAIRKTEKLNKS